MQYHVDVAENIASVRKVMLTCFNRNAGGLAFYRRLGFETDEFSPQERQLRGGKVVTPDYTILSRRCKGKGTEGEEGKGDGGS